MSAKESYRRTVRGVPSVSAVVATTPVTAQATGAVLVPPSPVVAPEFGAM